MGILLFVLGALLVIICLTSWRESKTNYERLLLRRNQDWLNFIAGYHSVTKTHKEKALIKRMLDDAAAQGFGLPDIQGTGYTLQPSEEGGAETATNYIAVDVYAAATAPIPMQAAVQQKPKAQLDNNTVLLYFGAFLFVASASLFVAFGGQAGVVRMLVVLLVSLGFYACGIWLHNNKPKLRQAGQTFAGIGIVLAPLVGAAFYTYVLSSKHGYAVWALTSVFCLLMYIHALRVFRSVLLGYVLIFTLLSLFESGIGIAHAPIYYYGWGLAVAGLMLRLIHDWKGWGPQLDEAASGGATLFVPVAVAVALCIVPSDGAGQLGVSLLIASAFYGLETLRSKNIEREADAVVAQVAGAFGVMALTYGATKNLEATVYSLLAVNVLQLLFMVLTHSRSKLRLNFGTILLALVCGGALLAIPYSGLLLVAVLAAVGTAVVMWLQLRRAEAYGIAAIGIVAAPYIAGQLTFGPLSTAWQTVAGFGAVLALLICYLAQSKELHAIRGGASVMAGTYEVGIAAVLISSLFASPLTTLLVALGLVATLLVIYRRDHNGEWIDIAGLVLLVPLPHAWYASEPKSLLVSAVVALVILILLALRFRREMLRWFSTILWLVLPLAVGSAHVLGNWSAMSYAWSYMLVLAILIFSRAIARGVLYLSNRVPMSSYARNASMSYVFGYIVAAIAAVTTSLASTNSRLHTTLILAVLTLVSVLLARVVEKRGEILAFVPVLVQAFLLSAVRPAASHAASFEFVFFSIIAAAGSYLILEQIELNPQSRLGNVHDAVRVSLAMMFAAPVSVVFGAESNWLMAVGLLLACLLLEYHIRNGKQADREMVGSIAVLAGWWMLAFAHVHEVQAYTHTVVALLGYYAYERAVRGERQASDQYLWWMIGVATVPLAIEALGSGSIKYGWWLLLEQVTIMLVGMAINRSFVTRWGLYVAVAAVLYQLRSYGYAALGVLALFLIGLAVFQLQKHTDKK